jgi:hypothetical protein
MPKIKLKFNQYLEELFKNCTIYWIYLEIREEPQKILAKI